MHTLVQLKFSDLSVKYLLKTIKFIVIISNLSKIEYLLNANIYWNFHFHFDWQTHQHKKRIYRNKMFMINFTHVSRFILLVKLIRYFYLLARDSRKY